MRVVIVLTYWVVGRLEILSMKFGTVPGTSPSSVLATSIPVSLEKVHQRPLPAILSHVTWIGNMRQVICWGWMVEGMDFIGSLKGQNDITKRQPLEFLGKRGRCKHRNWMKSPRTFTT